MQCTTLCDKVCQCLDAGRWFSQGTPVSSTNKTDHHDIAEILLKLVGIVGGLESVVPSQYQDRHELVEDHAITLIICGER